MYKLCCFITDVEAMDVESWVIAEAMVKEADEDMVSCKEEISMNRMHWFGTIPNGGMFFIDSVIKNFAYVNWRFGILLNVSPK